jgi:hypothetical protein
VVNPGRIPDEDFMAATDPAIVVIQEQGWPAYGNWPPPGSWVWNRADVDTPAIPAERLAIIAHTLSEPADVDLLIVKAAQYKIGWIYAHHVTGSIYNPLSTHLRLLEDRLGRCSRLGCTTPFSRFLCQLTNFFVCCILRAYRRLRVIARRRA